MLLLVVQVLLLLGEPKEPGTGELSTLSPQIVEVVITGAAFGLVFLVLWLVFSLPAALKAWQRRGRGA
ncbi:hypothetical protein ASD66_04160 [Nocardioides sp. Root151]|nr:hypothetical protein ASD66_04160 [Nocardioides sp. Root151]